MRAALPNSRAAESARVIARDVIEYLDSIDFNKYYESLQKPSARTGEAQKMFMDFSLSSIRAAKVRMSSARTAEGDEVVSQAEDSRASVARARGRTIHALVLLAKTLKLCIADLSSPYLLEHLDSLERRPHP